MTRILLCNRLRLKADERNLLRHGETVMNYSTDSQASVRRMEGILISNMNARMLCRARGLLAAILCLFILSGGARAVAAQSANKVVERYIKARGGEKSLRRVRTRQAKGTVTRQRDNAKGSCLTAAMPPDLYALRMQIGEFKTGAGFNGRSGWRMDSREGLRTLTGAVSADFQAEASYRNHGLLDYKKNKSKLAYAGPSTVRGRAAHAIVLTTGSDVQIKMYFDKSSGLLVKEELPAGEDTKVFEYADYRAVNQVMEPFAVTLFEGGERYDIDIEEVVHNRTLDRSLFDFPRSSDEPLPDIPSLLARVIENQKRLDLLREKYAYTETITSREFDKRGALKNRESETYEITFYRGHHIRRLINKNGHPISDEDLAKEDRRIEKIIKDLEGGKQVEDPYKNRRLKVADLLRTSRFINPRRERFRQRDVIVCDFERDPGYEPTKGDNPILGKIAGSIWIDSDDLQLARVAVHLVESFKAGGGVFFAMKPGARFIIEQARFNNEIWLPSHSEINYAGRAVLFVGVNVNQTIEYGDYHYFDVKSEEKLKPPTPDKKPAKL
ncbi:MAG: hypothetical protein L0229_00365 [Blastocatellia bacterium]|nr:hypothetical protein [Blastocatellia bacterium]